MFNEAEVKTAFRKKYDYLNANEIDITYQTAIQTYLDIAFPFDASITKIPEDRPRAYAWVYDCMCEIIEKSGCSSMTSYSENGLSISWDSTGVSKGLKKRITPRAGVYI